jgi:hypothetical protein
MASAPTTRVSAGEYLDHHGHHRPPSPTSSLSPTLVNDTRTPLKLTFPCGSSNILNSVVVDTAGQTLYAISSNSKRTTLVSCRDNVEIATVQWDRSSPRMVFRQKRIKCKAWLPLSGPEDGYYMSCSPLIPNLSVIPTGLARSHTAMHNSLGHRGPPLVMCVSAPAKMPFAQG